MAKLQDKFWQVRETYQPQQTGKNGITKDRVREVLRYLGLTDANTIDAVWALLDDTLPSEFPSLRDSHRFSDGATTAQIACHVGILQRGEGKLDREGRDYWIKPLRELGAIEAITLPKGHDDFVPGHIVAKSPHSGYRLDPDFVALLQTPEHEMRERLKAWASKDASRERLRAQAEAAERSRRQFDNAHAALIEEVQEVYLERFLAGYRVVYVDVADGDRITEEEREALEEIGLELTLDDPFPDVILYHPGEHAIWCVEAVTSDGEVDLHKQRNLERVADRSGLKLAGLTTAYASRKAWLRRQAKYGNIATGTYIWLAEDPTIQYHVLGS